MGLTYFSNDLTIVSLEKFTAGMWYVNIIREPPCKSTEINENLEAFFLCFSTTQIWYGTSPRRYLSRYISKPHDSVAEADIVHHITLA